MASFPFSSLELRKQLLLLVVLIFLPILGILLYTGFQAYEDARFHTEKGVHLLIERFIDEQVDIINNTRQFLRIVAQVPGVKTLDIPVCNTFLQQIHSNHPQFTTIVVADPGGTIDCCAIPLKKSIHVGDRSWFKRVIREREFIIGDFLISRSAQKASLPFAYPVLDADGNLLAAVGAAFDLNRYKKIFDGAVLPDGSVIMITDRKGGLLYQSYGDKGDIGLPLSERRGLEPPLGQRGSFRADDKDGTAREYWFERISVGHDGNQICLMIGIPEQAMLSDARRTLILNLVLLGLVAATSMAIAWFFGNHLVFHPIHRLLDRTRLIRQGDFRVPDADSRFPGELEMLSRAFDDMAVALSQREKDRDDVYRIINSSPVVGFIYKNEPGWPVIFVTENVTSVLGYAPEDFLSGRMTYDRVVHPDDQERVEETVLRFGSDPSCASFAHTPFRFFASDGSIRWVDHRVSIERDDTGRIVRYHGVLLDVTEWKKAEEEIRDLRNNLSDIIDSMPSALIGADGEGRVTQWNHGAVLLTGISKPDAVGKSMGAIFSGMPEGERRMLSLFERAVESRRTVRDLKVSVQREGSVRYEDITVFPLTDSGSGGAVIRIDDVTEKIRMEEVLIQNEKMLSVGGLAAGMAHEINNPLAGVIQNINVLENRLFDREIEANADAARSLSITMETITAYMEMRGVRRTISAVKNAGARMTAIVQNMLSFAREEIAQFSSHDPVELLDNTLELAATDYDLKRQYDFRSIVIEKEYEADLPQIRCEGGKIQQVLLNLLNNGAHAMFERRKDEPGAPASAFVLRLSYDRTDRMLQIEIEDNGSGIDPTIRKKIFDPFFTTKPVGIGTGLGLSVSYFIVTENHGGTLDVESAPGKGANFIIRLPVDPATP